MEDFVFYIMEQWIKQHSEKQVVQQPSLFADDEVKPGEKEWQQLIAMLGGDIGDELQKLVFLSYDGNKILVKATSEQRQRIEDCLTDDVVARIRDLLKRAYGKSVTWKYFIAK